MAPSLREQHADTVRNRTSQSARSCWPVTPWLARHDPGSQRDRRAPGVSARSLLTSSARSTCGRPQVGTHDIGKRQIIEGGAGARCIRQQSEAVSSGAVCENSRTSAEQAKDMLPRSPALGSTNALRVIGHTGQAQQAIDRGRQFSPATAAVTAPAACGSSRLAGA